MGKNSNPFEDPHFDFLFCQIEEIKKEIKRLQQEKELLSFLISGAVNRTKRQVTRSNILERYRKILEMRKKDELTFNQIGQRLNISNQTARDLFYKALRVWQQT